MPETYSDIDPYAELDNRADAAELSEGYRPPPRLPRPPRRDRPVPPVKRR